ncbi:MAG: hypothetical protein QF404_01625, partial [Planctomycetota bacterium]|nr:hypothetical protein [Planctomycetota bacterium]
VGRAFDSLGFFAEALGLLGPPPREEPFFFPFRLPPPDRDTRPSELAGRRLDGGTKGDAGERGEGEW